METHPIPQQISSYQFRLVGDMTLKQFFQIAGGCLIALLLYSLDIYPLIKWPLIFISVLVGVALAFLPFQERPLEQWIFAFFRSVYSPTLFNWKKTLKTRSFFKEEAPTTIPQATVPTVPSQKTLDIYLSNPFGSLSPFSSKFEEAEKAFLGKISQLEPKKETPKAQPTIIQPSQSYTPTPAELIRPKLVVEEKPQAPIAQPKLESVAPFIGVRATSGNYVQFSLQAAPPSPPTTPNTIVGQAIDTSGKIIEGVILEIRDAAGRPVRALKSNKLGHFMVVTPLTNGKYQIIAEKDGFTFTPASFDALGAIIPPIAISGKPVPSIAVLQN